MTPLTVCFTGLKIDPMELIERVHRGVIPEDWFRYRFFADSGTVSQINKWLTNNIEGRWAIMISYVYSKREVTIAFERSYDGSMFVLSDGATQSCQEYREHF